MIRLKRRRGKTQVPKRFQLPKTMETAGALAAIYYEAQTTGRYTFVSSAWKPAKNVLRADSGGKCAYCEASTQIVAHGDVEHFRPKSIYWWLAFVFDNYLFSCQICNQTHKGDKFPVSGNVLAPPAMPPAMPAGETLAELLESLVIETTAVTDEQIRTLWEIEDADLPNPYFEDPEALFAYEADDLNREIWLRSSGGARADRALTAAEMILGLNREELRRQRYADYRPFLLLRATLGQIEPDLRQEVLDELRIQQNQKQPFAGMKRFFALAWGLPGPV